ncbi:MAG: hypothetical protein ABIQ51_18620 [Mesorhizobium sp.]
MDKAFRSWDAVFLALLAAPCLMMADVKAKAALLLADGNTAFGGVMAGEGLSGFDSLLHQARHSEFFFVCHRLA